MRLNLGGWSLYNEAFKILFNEDYYTLEDSYRCTPSNFNLCPSGNKAAYKISGNPPPFYDKPIAVLLGPPCISMGDVTAQRLRYHQMVKFFGKPSASWLGSNVAIQNFPNWRLNYSISDMFHVNQPRTMSKQIGIPHRLSRLV